MASTTCGRCGRLTHMTPHGKLVAARKHEFSDWTSFEQAYTCDHCRRISIQSATVETNETLNLEEIESYDWFGQSSWTPVTREVREFADVPEHIAQASSEATLCLSMGANRAVGALTRAVIEATAKEKGITTGSLWAKIDSMYDSQLIREHVRDAAHEVRHFGNDMAHGDFVDHVTDEEASEAVELMAEVLNEVFQSRAKIERVRAARLAKKSGAGASGRGAANAQA